MILVLKNFGERRNSCIFAPEINLFASMKRVFRRKIYGKMLTWKSESSGRTALLIEGARRVGKSTIVEEFAKNEYKSYILIDFNRASKDVKLIFDDLMDIDRLFIFLQATYHVNLYKRNSVIIFDEVDFLISRGSKVCPIEVKSSGYKTHASLDAFCNKYSDRIGERYLIYTKDYAKDGATTLLPVFMTPLI